MTAFTQGKHPDRRHEIVAETENAKSYVLMGVHRQFTSEIRNVQSRISLCFGLEILVLT
jgi:hypothetical protein